MGTTANYRRRGLLVGAVTRSLLVALVTAIAFFVVCLTFALNNADFSNPAGQADSSER